MDDFHHPRPEAIDGYKSGCNCQGRREVLLYPLFAKKSEATGVIVFDIILIITFVSPIVAMRLLARRFLGRLHLDEESEEHRVAIYCFERLAGVILFFQIALPPLIIMILVSRMWIFGQTLKVYANIFGNIEDIWANPLIASSAIIVFLIGFTGYIAFNARYMSKQLRIAKTGSLAPSSTRCSKKLSLLLALQGLRVHCLC